MDILEDAEFHPPVPGGSGEFCGLIDPPPEAVLFDIYGSLIRSAIDDLEVRKDTRLGNRSFSETARRFGLDPALGEMWHEGFFSRIESFHKKAEEMGIKRAEVLVEAIWKKILRESGVDVSLKEAKSFAMFRELSANPCAAIEGAADCLIEVRRAGMRLGLATNSQFYSVPVLERALGIDVWGVFERELSILSYEVGFAKPDPHFFLMAGRKLAMEGIRAEETLVVGNDPVNDVAAASGWGFRTALFIEDKNEPCTARPDDQDTIVVYNCYDLIKALGVQ